MKKAMNDEISNFSNVVIRASAGSGKTFQLSNRYLKLLLSNEPVEKILATTFTKKAAGEILDRILMRLGQAALDEKGSSALSMQLYGEEGKISLSEVRARLVMLVKNFHRLRICTLDSFFMKIAGNFSLELGLPPGWQIAELPEIQRVLRTAIRNVFYNLTNTSNNAALKLMYLLEKGTIKRAVADQIFDLSQNLSEIYRQSEKEAWETISFQKEIPAQDLALEIDKFKSAELPKVKSGKAPDRRIDDKRKKLVELISEKKWDEFVSDSLVLLTAPFLSDLPLKSTAPVESQALRASLSSCTYYAHNLAVESPAFWKSLLVFTEQARTFFLNKLSGQTRGTWLLLDYINREFDRLKKEEGSYTFSDITDLLARSEWPRHREQLVHRLDAETNHLLLDEFQDTSCPQWMILDPLARRAVDSEEGSFFCVGDVKQAIYGWRGGNSGIFDSVTSSLGGVTSESLCDNWRSSPVIIETVNAIFCDIKHNEILTTPGSSKNVDYQNRMQEAFVRCCSNWQERFELHQSAVKNRDLSGYASFEIAPFWDSEQEQIVLPPEDAIMDPDYDQEFLAQKNESKVGESGLGDNILNLDFEDGEDSSSDSLEGEDSSKDEDRTQERILLRYTIGRIIELHHQMPEAEIGVLLRTNDQIAKIVTELRRRGLNVSEEGGTPLDAAASVEVILSILTIADHPEDTVSLYHIATVSELSQFFRIDESNYSDPRRGCAISHWLRRELLARGLPAVISQFACLLIPNCDNREEERLERLMELACKYQDRQNTRFDMFIERVRAERVETSGGSSIRVMTIHRSKGLEFDIVVLPQLDKKFDGNSPKVIAHRDKPLSAIDSVFRYVGSEGQTFLPAFCKEHLRDYWSAVFEESLSDLYVALTRPVRQLVMISPPQKDENYTKKNWANIIRFALISSKTEKQPELWRQDGSRTCWHAGDSLWWKKENFAAKKEVNKEEVKRETPLFDPHCFTLKFTPQEWEGDLNETTESCLNEEVNRENANIAGNSFNRSENSDGMNVADKISRSMELPASRVNDNFGSSENSDQERKAWENAEKLSRLDKLNDLNRSEKTSDAFLFEMNNPSNYIDRESHELSGDSRLSSVSNSALDRSSALPGDFLSSQRAPSDKGKRRQWSSSRNYELGTAIHLCFQQIQWLDQSGIPSKEKLHQILQSVIFSKDQEERIIQNFYNMLENKEIRRMLSLSCYTESGKSPINTSRNSSVLRWSVEQERRYSFIDKEGVIRQGIIDRLVVLYEGSRALGADIIDYKTDHIDQWNRQDGSDFETVPAQARELLKLYAGQLHEYQSAVMRLYRLPANKISCRCAFVSHGKIFDL